MTGQTIPQITVERKKIREILHDFSEFYKYPTKKLVAHLRSQGYSYQKIGDIMGMTKQAVVNTYEN